MDTVFPFGLPAATAFYLVFYVVTLVAHVAFMNYVLAGTGWLAVEGVARKADGRSSVGFAVLKDWMPLMLSGAITAGIGPLLFLQILYKTNFYTANLLLFHRWMSILPVLIGGFYTLYLLKTGWVRRRAGWVVAGISVVPFACVAFTGYSWTENHLLSVRSEGEWASFYGTGSTWYAEPQLVPRLLVWAFGSVPTMATILGWQLRAKQQAGDPAAAAAARPLARLAVTGLGLTGVAAAAYYLAADDATRAAFTGPLAWPYFVAAVLGLGLQSAAWVGGLRADRFTAARLGLASAGLFLTVVGMTVCREAVRIATLGTARFEALQPVHKEALGKSGFVWFLVVFVVNSGLVGLCIWIVRTQKKPADPGDAAPPAH